MLHRHFGACRGNSVRVGDGVEAELVQLVLELSVVAPDPFKLLCGHSSASACLGHIFEQSLDLNLDEIEASLVKGVHLGLELLVLLA